MISFFRSFLNSKVGAGIALAVLGIIALAFASGDISSFKNSANLGGGSAIASIGSESVDANELAQGANRALERVKQEQPTATMKLLVAQGGLEQILDDLIDRTAFYVFGKDNGIRISDRLIDSEITKIQAFQGVDGKFDQNVFRQALTQQGISEAALRADFAQNLATQQLALPATTGSTMSDYAARRYAALLSETRSGTVVALPSALFAPIKDPTPAELAAFYRGHTNAFIRPERRVIRFASFGADALKNAPAATDAEIAARFAANKALYAAQDKRRITQLIVPTEAAAQTIVSEVGAGKTLESAASGKGLSAAKLEFFSREDLSRQFSADVAQSVFAAPVGKLAAPRRSALGWHVIRVDEEQKKPARQLAEVREELAAQIGEEKHRKALADMLANIEDQFADGASLTEVAKSIGAEVQTSAPLTADGKVYAKPDEAAPELLKPVLATAFTMEQEEPQVAEVERGKTFVVFDVTDIAPSAPAPLAEITPDVKEAWKLDAGSRAAKAAAIAVQAEVRKGKSLEQAVAALGKSLPPAQQVAMSRPALSAALREGKQVPPPVSLMFHMAKGTVKVQSAGQERGWFVVLLNDIVPAQVDSPELVAGTRRELGQQLGQAYAGALARAIRKDLGVTTDAAALKALKDQLAGTGTAN